MDDSGPDIDVLNGVAFLLKLVDFVGRPPRFFGVDTTG
jgi:hypothetical protein